MVRKSFIKSLTNEELNIWDKLEDLIGYNKVSIFLKHLYRFLLRLPKWVKLCWKSENWDYEPIYDFIEMQLKEMKQAQDEDTWHVEKETKRRSKQISITLQRLDRFRNWPEYYDYPMDDIIHVKVEDPKYGTCYRIEHTNKDNEIQRLGAHDFETHNYDKFWKDFLQWHQGWWT